MTAQPPSTNLDEGSAPIGLVAIAADNSLAHGYVNVEELIGSNSFLALDQGIDFFDTTGRRLAPRFKDDWRLVGLSVSPDQPGPEELQHRLCLMIGKFEESVRGEPSAMKRAGLVGPMWEDGIKGVIGRLPRIEGKSLEASLESCAELLGHPAKVTRPPGWSLNSGGPLHNLIHAIGKS
jgi:hypothetical protein